MIYVPDKENYKCFNVYSQDVIRAYKEIPQANTTISYRDYFINSSYIFRDGTQQFSSYSTIPVCLSNDIITSDYYYRLDLDKILIIFIIIVIVSFYFPIKLFSRLFRRSSIC